MALAIVLAALGGCISGESPFDGAPDDAAIGSEPPAAAIEQLNRMNAASLTETRWDLSLSEPCVLRMQASGPGGDIAVGLVDLLAIDVQVKGNLGATTQAVQIDRSSHPVLEREHLFEADRWTQAVEYASHVKALQRACAGSR